MSHHVLYIGHHALYIDHHVLCTSHHVLCMDHHVFYIDHDLLYLDHLLRCFPPGLDFIVAFFGCLICGIVPVPVYPPDPTRYRHDVPRFLDVLEAAEVTTVLVNLFYRYGVLQ